MLLSDVAPFGQAVVEEHDVNVQDVFEQVDGHDVIEQDDPGQKMLSIETRCLTRFAGVPSAKDEPPAKSMNPIKHATRFFIC